MDTTEWDKVNRVPKPLKTYGIKWVKRRNGEFGRRKVKGMNRNGQGSIYREQGKEIMAFLAVGIAFFLSSGQM